ncbi:MAG TPA: type II toxin-antitoxin system RelE/ParE family toxin [Candidatus Limnocylindria bacterium]|nr:type II toxin-antitoxin system RelE/ParE family toxin [Candidatus Limnocylindria bacterium]
MADVRVSRQAARDLERLPKVYLAAAAAALRSLGPAPLGGKPLTGDLTGLRSLRVGMYRIVYRFDPRSGVVDVVWIRHRREVYRRAR